MSPEKIHGFMGGNSVGMRWKSFHVFFREKELNMINGIYQIYDIFAKISPLICPNLPAAKVYLPRFLWWHGIIMMSLPSARLCRCGMANCQVGMIGSQLGGTILKHLLGKKITNNQHFEKCIVHVAKSSCPDLQIPIEKNTIVFLFETRCGLTVCWDSNVNVFHFLAFFCWSTF